MPGRHAQLEGHRQHVALLGPPRALADQAFVPHVALLVALLVVLDQLDHDRVDGLRVGRGVLEEAVEGRVVGEGVGRERDQDGPVVVAALAPVGHRRGGWRGGTADANGRRHAHTRSGGRSRGCHRGRRVLEHLGVLRLGRGVGLCWGGRPAAGAGRPAAGAGRPAAGAGRPAAGAGRPAAGAGRPAAGAGRPAAGAGSSVGRPRLPAAAPARPSSPSSAGSAGPCWCATSGRPRASAR